MRNVKNLVANFFFLLETGRGVGSHEKVPYIASTRWLLLFCGCGLFCADYPRSFTILAINVRTKWTLCCADRLAMALWEVDGPKGSIIGVPNSMYLVTLSNSSQLRSLPVTDSGSVRIACELTITIAISRTSFIFLAILSMREIHLFALFYIRCCWHKCIFAFLCFQSFWLAYRCLRHCFATNIDG